MNNTTQYKKKIIVHINMKVGNGNLRVEEFENKFYYTLDDATGTIVYRESEIRKMVNVLNDILNGRK